MLQLPKYIKYMIISRLLWIDIQNFRLTTKINNELCKSDEFWQYKTRIDYPSFIVTKPADWSYWFYYNRILRSGQPQYLNDWQLFDFNIQTIYSLKVFADKIAYIDLYGDVYIKSDEKLKQFYKHADWIKLNLDFRVKDIIIIKNSYYILTLDHRLFHLTDNLKLLRNDIKQIEKQNSIQGYIIFVLTIDGTLETLKMVETIDNRESFDILDKNVTILTSDEINSTIYYVVNEQFLYKYTIQKKFIINSHLKIKSLHTALGYIFLNQECYLDGCRQSNKDIQKTYKIHSNKHFMVYCDLHKYNIYVRGKYGTNYYSLDICLKLNIAQVFICHESIIYLPFRKPSSEL